MRFRLYILGSLLILIFGLIACQPKIATPDAASNHSDFQLTVKGPSEEKTYTLDQIKSMPTIEGQAGIKSSTGKITLPAQYKGVLLTDILKEVGGDDPSLAVEVEAKDGYSMTFTYDQVAKGVFTMYDPATGEESTKGGPLQVILAYETEGKALDPEMDGYLRLMVISPDANQVVDGHWATKFVTKLTVKPLIDEWTLKMQGAIDYDVDRGSFESCSTAKCHPASWQDSKSQIWAGVPLYMLIGEVDDENKHDEGAFNKALADAGYTIDIISKDGYTVTLDSKMVSGNDKIIVAYTMNDNPLNKDDFPLRLVGPDLDKKQSVGSIASIVLHIDKATAAEPTVEPTPEPVALTTASNEPTADPQADSGAVAFEIKGKVETPAQWTLADLNGMKIIEATVDGPKDKKVNAKGVLLSDLLDLVGVKPDAKTMVIKAADGYYAEVEIKSVAACENCMVAFDKNDTLKAVMPGMDSSAWVKELVLIEIK